VSGVTYDSGALIAAGRRERGTWARHQSLLLQNVVPTVPAPVVAQCWHGTSRQAGLAQLLAGCDVESFDNDMARASGILAGRAGTTDVVGACVVEGAARRDDLVISANEDDLNAIAAASSLTIDISRP
jgi:hypothetical protein